MLVVREGGRESRGGIRDRGKVGNGLFWSGDETDEEELAKSGCVVASVSPSVRFPLQVLGGSGPEAMAEDSGLCGMRTEEGEDHEVERKAPAAGDESPPPAALSCACSAPPRGDM
jgi:hypothetical protein